MTAIIAETLSSLLDELNKENITKDRIVQIFFRPSKGANQIEYVCIYTT